MAKSFHTNKQWALVKSNARVLSHVVLRQPSQADSRCQMSQLVLLQQNLSEPVARTPFLSAAFKLLRCSKCCTETTVVGESMEASADKRG